MSDGISKLEFFNNHCGDSEEEEHGKITVPKNLIRQLYILQDVVQFWKHHFFKLTPQKILMDEDWETKYKAYEFGLYRGRAAMCEAIMNMLSKMPFWDLLSDEEADSLCFGEYSPMGDKYWLNTEEQDDD